MALEQLVKVSGTAFAAPHAGPEVDKINVALLEVDSNTADSLLNNTHRTGSGTDHSAVAALQDEVDTGVIGQARLICSTLIVANDTITIGADVYEADGVGANINFAIVGGDPGLTMANLIVAINTSGTENVFASVDSVVATIMVIENADAPGGTPTVGTANIALAEAITPAGDIWDQANLNATGSARFSDRAEGTLVVDATNVAAAPLKIELSFTPTELEWAAFTAAGVPEPTTATGVITAGQLVFTLGTGGTPLVATDFIIWRARG